MSFFISAMILVFSFGSPGPFESMMPSGARSRISFAVAFPETVVTLRPRFRSSRRMFAFAPKSHRTTFFPLPSFMASFWSFTFVPSERTGTKRYSALSLNTTSALSSILTALHVTLSTASVILYALIFLRSFAFSAGFSNAA